jgi:hypothetical protein
MKSISGVTASGQASALRIDLIDVPEVFYKKNCRTFPAGDFARHSARFSVQK